mgnify:CR=1 FL=1
MSNPSPLNYNESQTGGCAKMLGWGCGAVLVIALFAYLSMFGQGGLVFPIIVAAVIVIILIVRSRKNSAAGASSDSQAPQQQWRPASTPTATPVQPAYGGIPPMSSTQFNNSPAPDGKYANPMCRHTFGDDQLADTEAFTCAWQLPVALLPPPDSARSRCARTLR